MTEDLSLATFVQSRTFKKKIYSATMDLKSILNIFLKLSINKLLKCKKDTFEVPTLIMTHDWLITTTLHQFLLLYCWYPKDGAWFGM